MSYEHLPWRSMAARFDAEIGAEPAPFGSILLRSEAASSAMIEHPSSGAKAMALADLGSDDKRNATEIVGNVCAMQAAIDLADGLDEHTILAMHGALMSHLYPEIAGKWRDEQVDRRGRLRTPRCRIRATAPRSRAGVDG